MCCANLLLIKRWSARVFARSAKPQLRCSYTSYERHASSPLRRWENYARNTPQPCSKPVCCVHIYACLELVCREFLYDLWGRTEGRTFRQTVFGILCIYSVTANFGSCFNTRRERYSPGTRSFAPLKVYFFSFFFFFVVPKRLFLLYIYIYNFCFVVLTEVRRFCYADCFIYSYSAADLATPSMHHTARMPIPRLPCRNFAPRRIVWR